MESPQEECVPALIAAHRCFIIAIEFPAYR